MIRREYTKTRDDGIKLFRTYSDKGYRIKQVQTGIIYDDAIDIEESGYIYEETTTFIEKEEGE